MRTVPEGTALFLCFLPLQREHHHLRPVEQAEGGPGVSQSPGDEHVAPVGGVEPGRVGGEEPALRADQAVGEGQADEAPVAVAGDDQIRAQKAVLLFKVVVPVDEGRM